MAIGNLIIVMAIISMMRLLLDMRLHGRKIWSYFFEEDGTGTDFELTFSLLILGVVLLNALVTVPLMIEGALFFILLPFLGALAIKGISLKYNS